MIMLNLLDFGDNYIFYNMDEKDLEETKKAISERIDLFKEELGGRKVEDLTLNDFDFQGWLIPHITLRKMLSQLGFKINEEKNIIYLENNNEILDKYPNIVQEDCMGYGAKSWKLTSANVSDGEVQLWY